MAETEPFGFLKDYSDQIRVREERARSLFIASLPELYAQWCSTDLCIVPSKIFPVYYKVTGQGLYAMEWDSNYIVGYICVAPSFELPTTERAFVLCLLLLKNERKVLKTGNWEGNPLFKAWDKLRRRYPRNIFDRLF